MANIPMKDIQFPGLDDTYTFAQVDATLTTQGKAADAKKTGDEISELKNDLTDMDDKIDASLITNTASGAIASFPDGADGVPVKDLVAQITPVQDLHGQANPYPGGGGKNKFDTDFENTAINGITITKLSDGKVTTSGVPTSAFDFPIGTATLPAGDYILNGCPADGGPTKYRLQVTDYPIRSNLGQDDGNGVNFTLAEEMTIAVRIQVYTGAPASLTYAPMIRRASETDPTFMPYENICPISGWTGANVSRTSKNILPITLSNLKTLNTAGTWSDNAYTYRGVTYTVNTDDGGNVESILVNGTAQYVSNLQLVANVNTLLTVGETYTLSGCASGGTSSTYYLTIATTPDTSRLAIDTGDSASFTCTSAYAETTRNGYITVAQGVSISNKTFKPMFEKGSSATAYVPYGNTYSIDWTTEAGTVYGGTLDVTTGVLTVDKAKIDLGERTWTKHSSNNFYAEYALQGHVENGFGMCTQYKHAADVTGIAYLTQDMSFAFQVLTDYRRIIIKDTTKIDFTESEFKSAMDGVWLVYELDEPVIYQLDPVTIATLLGQNNIWADCGDTTVDYRADTKLYIEQLTAPSEDDMVANTNIPDATYFMIGNTLYLSTTTIPAGDTINPGTNCTQMNLASALNALNS